MPFSALNDSFTVDGGHNSIYRCLSVDRFTFIYTQTQQYSKCDNNVGHNSQLSEHTIFVLPFRRLSSSLFMHQRGIK